MSAVVEHGKTRFYRINSFAHTACIVSVNFFRQRINIVTVINVHTASFKLGSAGFTITRVNKNYVKKNTVCIIIFTNLFNFSKKLLEIGCVKTHIMISYPLHIYAAVFILVFSLMKPFRVLQRCLVVKASRDINGSFNTDFMRGFNLSAKQIKV